MNTIIIILVSCTYITSGGVLDLRARQRHGRQQRLYRPAAYSARDSSAEIESPRRCREIEYSAYAIL